MRKQQYLKMVRGNNKQIDFGCKQAQFGNTAKASFNQYFDRIMIIGQSDHCTGAFNESNFVKIQK